MDKTGSTELTNEPPVKLRRLGFFDEFTYALGPDGSVRDAVRPIPLDDASRIADYLDSGPLVLAFVDTAIDVLDGVSKILDSGNLVTDGSWVWDTQLSYYFRRYNIALPSDFLAQVRANNYVNPREGVEDLSMNVTW